MIYSFTKIGNAVDWKSELPKFMAALGKDNTTVVSLEDKYAADVEIRRRVADLKMRREDGSIPAAWTDFVDRAKEPGTEEAALLAVSMAGVRTMTNHPSAGGRS